MHPDFLFRILPVSRPPVLKLSDVMRGDYYPFGPKDIPFPEQDHEIYKSQMPKCGGKEKIKRKFNINSVVYLAISKILNEYLPDVKNMISMLVRNPVILDNHIRLVEQFVNCDVPHSLEDYASKEHISIREDKLDMI